MTELKIVEFDAAYADDFKRLNLVWLERYFQVEPIDLEVLSNPEEAIIKPGGMVFFALRDGAVVGTCALIKHDAGLFELSKMAVADTHQGHGIGTHLLGHVIEWARSRSIRKLFNGDQYGTGKRRAALSAGWIPGDLIRELGRTLSQNQSQTGARSAAVAQAEQCETFLFDGDQRG